MDIERKRKVGDILLDMAISLMVDSVFLFLAVYIYLKAFKIDIRVTFLQIFSIIFLTKVVYGVFFGRIKGE